MYYVDVYEEDRMTFAGTKEFTNTEACKHFALLNQPCIVFHIVSDMYLEDDNDSLKKLLNILHEKVIYGDQEE